MALRSDFVEARPRPRDTIPNRIVIGAIDSALNRTDLAIGKEGNKVRCNAEIMHQLRAERDALVEARTFIAANRKDP
jgi:hypothetical protein